MKEKFLEKSLNYIKKNKELDHYNEVKLKYGLEVLYHFITKLVFILLFSLVLGIFKQVLLMIAFYGPLRACVHGIHSNSNIGCWTSTIIDYILFGLYLKYFPINKIVFFTSVVIAFISYILFAPADTKYRPLVGKNNRKRLKLMALIFLTLELALCLIHNFLIPYVFYSSIITVIIINPIVYSLFHNSTNNYKNYNA